MLHQRIKTYQEFWRFYLREHSHPMNRRLHLVGTSLAVILCPVVWMLNPWCLPLLVLLGYAFAWIGHYLIEKNSPATFQYPLWSFISDFKMLYCALTGKLSAELLDAGVRTSLTP